MERIVLRHLSGSKANQVEEFPLSHVRELSIGRDPSSVVRYDADRDDLVGRQHARIAQDPSDPNQFTITDLNSRNGTYVNKKRIVGTVRIVPGDIVQLGPGGPEFQFDVEPRPEGVVRSTRIAELGTSSNVPLTRAGEAIQATGSAPPAASIGKATVERMIAETRGQSRKYTAIAVLALLAVIAIVGAVLIYQNISARKQLSMEMAPTKEAVDNLKASAPMTPAQIAQAYTNATVYIEVGWSLIYTRTGGQVYHLYVPNKFKDKDGKERTIVQESTPVVFACREVQNRLEPALTLDNNHGFPIGGNHTGSGFCVTNDGFILTNRHVAATWNTSYHYRLREEISPNVLVNEQGKILLDKDGDPILINPPRDWVPAESRQFGVAQVGSPQLEGRNDYLNVTFAKNELRFQAKLVRVSDRHDVAMIKIDTPESVTKVALLDNYDTIKPGDAAIVMGYPGVSPPVMGFIESKDVFNREQRVGVIPDPTISVGYIGRVLRGQDASAGKDAVYSSVGDAYQLTINSTGGGNSGGPLFDDRGRVMGIYFAGTQGMDAQISFAVPIRFGKELMTATPVMR